MENTEHPMLEVLPDVKNKKYTIPVAESLASLMLVAMILIQSIAYGFSYKLSSEIDTVIYFFIFSLLFFCLAASIALLAFFNNFFNKQIDLPLSLDDLAGLSIFAVVISTLFFYSGPLPIGKTVGMLTVSVLTVGLLVLRLPKIAIWILTCVGSLLFVYASLVVPIDVAAANMLPIIVAGCEDLIAGAQSIWGHVFGNLFFSPFIFARYCFASLRVGMAWL
ncbi:MAG: hypothetical protein MZV65_22485 [Chromatiales bacterium]|nr:hypothetical protein [Chromatiales bacterium]